MGRMLDDEPVDPKQDLQEWFKAPWKEFMSMNADDRYEDALRKKELKNKRRRELYAKSQEEKNMQEPQSDCNRAFLVDEDTEPRSRRRRAVSATKTKQVAKEIHGENIQIRERKSMRFVGVSSAPSASNHDVTLEDGQLPTSGVVSKSPECTGGFVAYIAFADCNIKTRAEGFLSSIMNSFEIVLRCNVEVKIILLPDLFGQQQMDPINSMKGENKSICSSAIEANLETAPGWLVSSR
ncbi:protein STICHEL [Forsythia ovata]|uniref:Protein STICHEL n=1 Tax=Forsythia ovata TaxID=205694 RepID=A0ABD1PK98_9LAMI